ncbi:MAG: hypothetical protein V4508_00695 [Pseudomonadota bacterium]
MSAPRSLSLTCLALLAAAWCAGAGARGLTVCVADTSYLPISVPGYEAPGQALARQAFEHQRQQVAFVVAPWRRCLLGAEAQEYDAVLGAAPNPSFAPFLAFPTREGKADPQQRLAQVTLVVLRRAGARASWDGERFEFLTLPVLYGAGLVIVRDKLAILGVAANDSAKTPGQLMRMLVAGRADVVVIHRAEAEAMLESTEFAGKIDLLETPFVTFDAYLAVRRSLLAAQPELVKAIWNDIARMAAAPAWAGQRQLLMARIPAMAVRP